MAQIETEPYADGTPLVELFGKPARTKLLSVFVDERDLNVSELARQAGIARSTVYDHLDQLVELGVITETCQTGPGVRYQLNDESEIAQKLYELDGLVLHRLLELDDNLQTAEADFDRDCQESRKHLRSMIEAAMAFRELKDRFSLSVENGGSIGSPVFC